MEHWTKRQPLDEALERWLREANNLLMNGARLAQRADREQATPGTYGALALLIYQRMTERQLDAEIRELLG